MSLRFASIVSPMILRSLRLGPFHSQFLQSFHSRLLRSLHSSFHSQLLRSLHSSFQSSFPKSQFGRFGLIAFGSTSFGLSTILFQKNVHNDSNHDSPNDSNNDSPKPLINQEDEEEPIAEKLKVERKNTISNWTLMIEIWKALKPDFLLLMVIIFTSCSSAFINVYTPLVIGKIVQAVQIALKQGVALAGHSALKRHSFLLMSLFSLQGLLTFVDIYLVSRLGENVASRIRFLLFEKILAQDLAFFDARMGGEISSRLSTDLSEFKHTFKLTLTQGLKSVTQVIGSIISLVTISPSLTLTLATSLPPLYIFMNFYGSFLRKLSRQSKLAEANATSMAQETINNIKTVKSFVGEGHELEKYRIQSAESCRQSVNLGWHIGLFQGLTNTSIGSMIFLILYYGGHLVQTGQMTGGELMTFMVATQTAQRSLSSVGSLFGQTIKAVGAAGRVYEYILLNPTILDGLDSPLFIHGNVSFDQVTFRYPTRPDQVILNEFTLSIPSGKVIAFVGASGSGKSTVGQLLERFYDPSSGQISIDGHDIKSLDLKWLRQNIGYINQEPTLFATSIRDNIRYADPNATDNQVEKAALEANAHEFIMKFPKGYDTIVGERGSQLSGGQRQRIAIARALLKNPKILILDEATSALDSQSERVVQEALDKSVQNRTVLVIAHRLSTIQNADKIIVLSNRNVEVEGNVLEEGTHQELMSKRGAYWKLYQKLELE